MDSPYIKIDGSYGEGGGQILRSALALSIILSRPIEIINIRKGRKKGGLQPQHLTCVNACRDISGAYVDGNEIGSTTLRFNPKGIKSGSFMFDVAEKRGSAGSTSLVLQTLLPPLILSKFGDTSPVFPKKIGEVSPSYHTRLTIKGGTHVPWSPPFHYLKEIFLPVIEKMGCNVRLSIDKWGWYPKGGGIVHADINPVPKLKGITLNDRGKLIRIYGLSVVSNLPLSIAERQRSEGVKVLKDLTNDIDIDVVTSPSIGKGTFFFIIAEYEGIKTGFSSLGAIGKSAEDVTREACKDFLDYHKAEGAVDPHLADQIIPYIALADGPSSFTTTKITRHLITNIWTVKQLMNINIKIEGKEGEKGRVVLE
ncbi:MAG: hypothetical protein A2Z60_05425 [Nitrospirae bacterium RIFCSPLOWO2_02_42_7]|nr:MAG: hypothetical protein A2Z60_05425 [Nitrospirae bacterium RIFCSPLOWO2_02_42_7]